MASEYKARLHQLQNKILSTLKNHRRVYNSLKEFTRLERNLKAENSRILSMIYYMNCQGSGEDKFGIGTGADPITSFSSKGLANNRRRYAYLASDPRANGRSPCKECGDLSDGSGFSMSSGSDYKARGVRERRELGPRKQAAGGRTIRRVAARGKSESTKASPLATSKYKGEEDREFGA